MARSVEEDQVLLHIGDIRKDHNYLGRAEYYPDINRNILFCPSGTPPFWMLSALEPTDHLSSTPFAMSHPSEGARCIH